MKILFVWFIGILSAAVAGEVFNVIDFSVKNKFETQFPQDLGYSAELADGKDLVLESKELLKIANLVADKFISEQVDDKNPRKEEYRRVIFRLSTYCLQIHGFINSKGEKFAFVNGFKIDEELSKKLPLYIVQADGMGNKYWQAYINLENGEVEIKLNDIY
jgi:hypothetical protein